MSGRWDRGLELDSAGAGLGWSWTRLAKNRAKVLPRRESGRLKSSFLGFLHFPTLGTSAGWELLCRMVKHTSKEFLCGREHVRVWKCRKTGTKVRSKSGVKTRPSRCPKHRKHRYTGKSSLQRGQTGYPNWSSKTPLNSAQNQLKNGSRFTTLHLTGVDNCLPVKCCAEYGNGEYRQHDHQARGPSKIPSGTQKTQ